MTLGNHFKSNVIFLDQRCLNSITMAFNAKNLHYEKQEPAFLRKLRGEHDGERHNVQIARPKKDRLKTTDEDDGPTIVDESGEVVSREEYEAMTGGNGAGDYSVDGGATGSAKDVIEAEQSAEKEKANERPEKQKVADIGGPRKRKAVKVIVEDDVDAKIVKDEKEASRGNSKAENLKNGKTKPAKRAKKVKLSFGESEE